MTVTVLKCFCPEIFR